MRSRRKRIENFFGGKFAEGLGRKFVFLFMGLDGCRSTRPPPLHSHHREERMEAVVKIRRKFERRRERRPDGSTAE